MRKHIMHTRNDRGSALLATLMVMVGLSLLGLGFVAISETESSISLNQRNATQTQQVAEAGLKLVVEWFQDPFWAETNGLMPTNTVDAMKPIRTVLIDVGNTYVGRYKSTAGTRLFDLPFKPLEENRFWGDETHPDVVINATTNQTFLNSLNQELFAATQESGRITDIRVYAPPMLGGTLNASGYWEKGTRLGIATVQVTATKCRNDSGADPCQSDDNPDRIIAQKTVRAVISEWPFPGPSGPVQTNADLNTNGNLKVHWGKITATGVMELKRPFGSLPWHDAYHPLSFQHGYFDELAGGGVVNDPWPHNSGSGNTFDKFEWLNEILGKALQDPWYEAWSRDDYTRDGAGGAFMPYSYDNPAVEPIYTIGVGNDTCGECRSVFQFQTENVWFDRKSILFPRMDYDFWKDIAISADAEDNVFYLRWNQAGGNFCDRDNNCKGVLAWVDTTVANSPVGNVPGYYFFDTKNGLNPQFGGPGRLTPTVSVAGWRGQMQGFIYLNAELWNASGVGSGGPDGRYNMPGEPYKDISFWYDNAAGTDYERVGGAPKNFDTYAGNERWDWDDANGNGVFDLYVKQRTFPRENLTTVTAWAPVPWYPGCTVGTNCSDPHEPYLNYIYPTTRDGGITVGWEKDNAQTRRAKITTNERPTGAAINCNAVPTTYRSNCTSNHYDVDGAIVTIGPSLNGVFYIEGTFEQTGNMHYFGSVLVQGDASKAGTPDVWFDERLIKGDWPPDEFDFPRVFISSMQVD